MSQGTSSGDPRRRRHAATDALPDAAWLLRMAEIEDRHPPISAGGFFSHIGRLAVAATGATPAASNVAEPATGWSASSADSELFAPHSSTYEAELAALCAKVEALVGILCQLQPCDAALAAGAVRAAIRNFTQHRVHIVASAIALSPRNLDGARHVVCQWACMAAMRVLRHPFDPQQPATIAASAPTDDGAAHQGRAGWPMTREQLEAQENALSSLIQLATEGRSPGEVAALIDGIGYGTSLSANGTGSELAIDARLLGAGDAWLERNGPVGEERRPQGQQVAVAEHGLLRSVPLTVLELQWRADGYLHGRFVQPPATALPDLTHGLARLRSRPGDESVFVVSEPFTMLWHDGAGGRTATFLTYLGPRPGDPERRGDLPATAVQFVLAG